MPSTCRVTTSFEFVPCLGRIWRRRCGRRMRMLCGLRVHRPYWRVRRNTLCNLWESSFERLPRSWAADDVCYDNEGFIQEILNFMYVCWRLKKYKRQPVVMRWRLVIQVLSRARCDATAINVTSPLGRIWRRFFRRPISPDWLTANPLWVHLLERGC